MKEEFSHALARNREKAAALGVRIRPVTGDGAAFAARVLSGSRLSDGFGELARLSRLDLSLEALAVEKRFTALFTDEQANEALSRLLEAGYRFGKK